jgi:hypothetical protein
LERKIDELTQRQNSGTSTLQASVNSLQAALAQERRNTAELNQNHDAEKERLQNEIATLKYTNSALETRIASMGPVFDVHYRYDANNMTILSRIISRYLLNKPENINSHRIFNCIKNCYDGAVHDENYMARLSLKMLLVTSYRSNWFTTNQDNRLIEWLRNVSV